MERGFLKIFRRIRDSEEWKKRPFSEGQAMIDLALQASYGRGEVEIHNRTEKANPGELLTSTRRLAEEWGWSRYKVRLFIQKLVKKTHIKAQRNAQRFTVMTIMNLGLYPMIEPEKNPENSPENQPHVTEKPRGAREKVAVESSTGEKTRIKKIYKRKIEEKKEGDRLTTEIRFGLEKKYEKEIRALRKKLIKGGMGEMSVRHETDVFMRRLMEKEKEKGEKR